MNNNNEVYANITNFPNYQISNFGNCKNVKTGRILKPSSDCSGGYLKVSLLVGDGKMSTKRIHKLVAHAFLENLEEKRCVDHKDRCKTNNHNASMKSTNTSGVIGVCWYKPTSKWYANIGVDGV